MSQDKKNEVQQFVLSFQFSGQGQPSTPVITFPGALKLVMFLPGDAAKKHRSTMATILTRYYAGDKALFQEIEANAVSESPVCQLARGALVDDSHKRKYEELEDLKLEAEATDVCHYIMEKNASMVEKYTALCQNQDIDSDAKSLFKDMFCAPLRIRKKGQQELELDRLRADLEKTIAEKANVMKLIQEKDSGMNTALQLVQEKEKSMAEAMKQVEKQSALIHELETKNQDKDKMIHNLTAKLAIRHDGFCIMDLLGDQKVKGASALSRAVADKFKQQYPHRPMFRYNNKIDFCASDRSVVANLVEFELLYRQELENCSDDNIN